MDEQPVSKKSFSISFLLSIDQGIVPLSCWRSTEKLIANSIDDQIDFKKFISLNILKKCSAATAI